MFKINKSSVRYMDHNMSMLAVEERDHVPRPQQTVDAGAPIQQAAKQAMEAAKKIEQQARQQADKLMDDARLQAAELREKAWQQGYEEGSRKGEEEAKQAYTREKRQEDGFMQQVGRRLEEFERGITGELETCLLELSVELAEKIVNKYIERNDIFIVDLIQAALSKIRDEGRITVRISPDDYDCYLSHADQLSDTAGDKLTVIRDELMKPGDCIFEREDSILDVGVSSQMNRMRKILARDKRSDAQHAVL